MNEIQNLKIRKQALLSQEDLITKEIRSTKMINEQYQMHFYEATKFFEDCRFTFHKNDSQNFYESVNDEFIYKSRDILQNLEDTQDELLLKHNKIILDLDDVSSEIFLCEEKETSNEH